MRFLSRPLRLADAVPATVSTIVNTINRARSGTAMAAPFAAPATNKLSGMFCNLQTQIADPGERLRAIAEASSRAKDHSSSIAPTLLLDWTEVFARAAIGFVFRVAARTPLTHAAIHNVIISNVAGPQSTLYGMGAEIKALYPLGPIFHGSGLNITVMSLGGTLNVGIISCPKLVDDLWDLADRFEPELDALQSVT